MERREGIPNRAEALIDDRAKLYDEVQIIDDGIRNFNNVFEPDPRQQIREFMVPDSPSGMFTDTRSRMGKAAGERIKNLVKNHVFEFYPSHYPVRQVEYRLFGPVVIDMQEVEIYFQEREQESRSEIPLDGTFWYMEKDLILARIFSLPIT